MENKKEQTIKAVLQLPEWGDSDCEVRFKDKRFKVWSYQDGDGIWGFHLDDEEFIELFGKELFEKWVESDFEELEIDVPFSVIEEKGYSILDNKRRVRKISIEDLWGMSRDGVVRLPDGRTVEPDAEDSPLMELGLI